MSFKIQLQEFFQKQGLSIPKYMAEHVGGEIHKPQWVATVYCPEEYPFPDKSAFSGKIRSRKKDAENSAAQVALQHIMPRSTKPLILIDLENQGDSIEFLKKYEFGAAEVWGIASIGHPTLRMAEPYITVKEIPTTVSDGADIGLCVLAARAHTAYSPIIIVSNDHFAIALQECLSGMFGRESHVVKSIRDLS